MIYHVFANRSNIGDWLSAMGIQKLLAQDEIVECLCDLPFLDETISRLSKATENDLVVIGGGGLIMDYFIPFWEAFKPFAERIPFCIWGIGCCDLKYEPSLPHFDPIEEIVSKSRLCVVRDEITRSYLRRYELPAPASCPSINIINEKPQSEHGFLHVANYSTAGAAAYESMRDMGQKFADRHGITFRETNNRINKDRKDELASTLALYEKSDIIFTSALHGCIIGLAMGRKVIAVSGDRKIEGFMDSMNLSQWVLDIEELDRARELLNKIHLQLNPEKLLNEMRNKNVKISEEILAIQAENQCK